MIAKRVVKRNCSFEGDSKFVYVVQIHDGKEWEDIHTISSDIGGLFSNADWESIEDLNAYEASENYVYGN